jgi:uncharacterized Zn finger protein
MLLTDAECPDGDANPCRHGNNLLYQHASDLSLLLS